MGTSKPQPPSNFPGPSSERLESWKEIAAYLKRDERTVRRWEAEGLPIHRKVHKKQASVFAYREEIDSWWNEDRRRLELIHRPVISKKRQLLPWLLASFVAAGLVALAALNAGGLRNRLRGDPPAASAIRSLAVLPLENLSKDSEQEYFADGMTEELVTELTRINALHVISRRSAIYYKGTKKTLPQIAKELGVDAVIEGTVQRSGDRVRVSAQLVEGRTDHHLWADTYDRDLHDVLALEGEVARAIAHEIQLKLTPEENARLVHRRPISTEAYEAYLKGLYYWNRLSEEDLRKSIDYFQRAIRLAPDFAPAYSGLAFSYTLLASQEFVAPQDAYPKAKELARKALELDENLADAHAALGFVLCYSDWNCREAEIEFRRAIELEPNAERGHHVYSLYLNDMGRNDEAIAEIKKSLEADPLSVLARWNLGYFYINAGQQEQAAEEFRKILEIAPGPDGHQGLGMAYTLENRLDDAIAELQEAVKALARQPMVQSIAGICVCDGRQENRGTESRGRFEGDIKTKIRISVSNCHG